MLSAHDCRLHFDQAIPGSKIGDSETQKLLISHSRIDQAPSLLGTF